MLVKASLSCFTIFLILSKSDAMIFETNTVYHIYNQGNNHHKIFFAHGNYLYFLKKIHHHILPFADVLAWCLMPNHFHLMILVNKVEVNSEAVTLGDKLINQPLTQSEGFTSGFTTTLNDSIGTMLRSYTRAINIQEERTGSLFRRKTKAECITKVSSNQGFTSSETLIIKETLISDREYLQTCFDYIHNNPMEAGLVKDAKDWEYSSYLEYCSLKNWKLINKKTAEELGLH